MKQSELTHILIKQLLMYKRVRYELISLPNVRLFASNVRDFFTKILALYFLATGLNLCFLLKFYLDNYANNYIINTPGY